jgi:acyl-coenzyme A synthetase/AMP-(fatty) acid ligase
MPLSEQRSLWELTSASGALPRRALMDETARVTLDTLATATALSVQPHALAGASVLLKLPTQLATILALLELDGVARRIVLCPPDLPDAHLPVVVATAETGFAVLDAPSPLLSELGVSCLTGATAPARDLEQSRRRLCETEWVMFTSGTTGPPKMPVQSLRSLTGAIAQPGAGDSVWCTFYDIRRYGGLQILLRALLGGGSMVLSGAHEAPADFLARGRAAGITFLSGTPTHWRRALLCPNASALNLRDVRLSGEIADQPILDKLRSVFPQANVHHAFASTEAGVAFDVADGLAGFPADWVGATRNGVDLRVADGTLRIRSARTASRYLGQTAGPMHDADGFVDTKDIVDLRDGRYYFMGRRDGVINVGGLKVHPEEVESVVNTHPGVQMSMVRSRKSPIIGAVVMVDVVRRGEGGDDRALEAEILSACRASLAAHKVPAAVRVVPSLPVTAAGKLLRSHA